MNWFYEKNGKVIGPVSRTDIIRLLIQRHIHPHSLVWTEEFGEDWRPVSRSGLIAPIPSNGLKEKKMPFFQIQIGRIGEHGAIKEKITKTPSEVSSFWAWIFLLVPVSLEIFLMVSAYIKGQQWSVRLPFITVLAFYVIMIISIVLDRKEIRSSGIRRPSFIWLPIWLLVPAVYFWFRATALGRGRILFLGSFILMAIRLVVLLYNPPSPYYHWKVDAATQHVALAPDQMQNKKQTDSQDKSQKQDDSQKIFF